ncbi:MAG: tetratricopeptide repeat protein [Verrucomicrobiota bacterium]|jgi:Tfp pilus assembly protein PilF
MTGQKTPPINTARTKSREQGWRVAAVCLVLAAITFAVFGQTAGFGFVNYDDGRYVYENPVVAKGLTLKGMVWALTYGKIGHWHPLTWLTHMADCQIYGLWAGGHHLTNVALHALGAVLLLLALKELTGSLWRSAFVAAVFAIHPLRVESVAWIAERKDVLSGVFFMLTLWAYARYARQPSGGRYAAVVLAYALGLLSKNSLMTLPFVLLLLDWWPLRRVKQQRAGGGKAGMAEVGTPFWKLVKEKIPLFLLTVGSCAVSFLVPEKVPDASKFRLPERLANAVVSYGVYLRQMVFPAGLANPYLFAPRSLPLWKVGLVFVFLAVISIIVLRCRNRRPYFLVGWLWYLGMMVPAIGLIQLSYLAHADRYTYLPGIGLVLAGTWAVGDWSGGWKHRRAILGGLMGIVTGAMMVCAWKQTTYWKSGETLWVHTLDCTTDNFVAQYNLGWALFQKGKTEEAIAHYRKALEINAQSAEAHYNLATALLRTGRVDEAIDHFQRALQIRPNDAEAHFNLGNALQQRGRMAEAIAHYQEALELNPGDAKTQNNLGSVLCQNGRADEAMDHFQKALEINPGYADPHNNLGNIFLQKGGVDEAIDHFQKALRINPGYAEAHNSLGSALFQKGRVDEALVQFEDALRLNPNYAEAHLNIGGALQVKRRMDEAMTHYRKALEIRPQLVEAQNRLAWLLAACPEASLRDGNQAVELARQANGLTGGENPLILHTLAAAYAAAGRFPEAVDTAQRALSLARAQSNTKLAGQLQYEMKLYEAGTPIP